MSFSLNFCMSSYVTQCFSYWSTNIYSCKILNNIARNTTPHTWKFQSTSTLYFFKKIKTTYYTVKKQCCTGSGSPLPDYNKGNRLRTTIWNLKMFLQGTRKYNVARIKYEKCLIISSVK